MRGRRNETVAGRDQIGLGPAHHVGPRELYGATRSSVRVFVSNVLTDPTVIAEGALPGDRMPAYPGSPVTGETP